MLGVIIGVAAVIAMVAIGQGATQSVQKQIASMGQNQLMVMPALVVGRVMFGAGSVQTLTPRTPRRSSGMPVGGPRSP
jgi:putative ABC transport system permease protein